jgi:glutamine cyclotransferase
MLAMAPGLVQSETNSPPAAAPEKDATFHLYQTTGAEWPNGDGSSLTNVPVYSYKVMHSWPHDRGAFTEGLVFHNGTLLESTGLNGQSTLREVELESGKVLRQVEMAPQYFGEGTALLGSNVYQLTWAHERAFVYDLASFGVETNFFYKGEGWGLTTDGQWLIMSDGSPQIRFIDPKNFEVKRTIIVSSHGRAVRNVNELEYINGEIFANIWRTDYMVRINPATGEVLGLIDFTGLLPAEERDDDTDVLNGIAYDAKGKRLFVTGKRWPKLFEVELKLKP